MRAGLHYDTYLGTPLEAFLREPSPPNSQLFTCLAVIFDADHVVAVVIADRIRSLIRR